ncbi:MAG: hypothetical protein AAGH76_14840 [Pseudomonadota bacterium]
MDISLTILGMLVASWAVLGLPICYLVGKRLAVWHPWLSMLALAGFVVPFIAWPILLAFLLAASLRQVIGSRTAMER